jgi:hypothetical protein
VSLEIVLSFELFYFIFLNEQLRSNKIQAYPVINLHTDEESANEILSEWSYNHFISLNIFDKRIRNFEKSNELT